MASAQVRADQDNSGQDLRRGVKASNSRGTAKQLWLDAWADPVAGLNAFTNCIHTCNLYGDGDWRLIVADADKKIKVWKGTAKASEHALLEAPVAITSFITDGAAPRLPTLAVAAGPNVYMFRSLRPYYKFTLPTSALAPAEDAVWKQVEAGKLEAAAAAQQLQHLQDKGSMQLAARSQQLLALSGDAQAQQQFVQDSSGQAAGGSLSCITCMDAVRQAKDELDAVSRLVLGTEDRRVLFLNAAGTAVDSSILLPSVPAFIATTGELDEGYRFTVAARDGRLYNIKSGTLSRSVIQLDSQPVGVVRAGRQIVVGTMADALHCYTGKGAKQYTLYMPASILTLQLLAAPAARQSKCVVVALSNGEVRVYNDKALVSLHSSSSSPVMGLCAGRYAREDCSLISVTGTGALDIKIMPRTANLEAAAVGSLGPPPEQDVPLDVPKKTRLYVEQTQRERQQAVDMHRVFQRDLAKMRLVTARAFVKVLTDGQGAASHAAAANLSMNVSIQGLGPRFRLLLNLSNESQDLATNLQVLVQAEDAALYQVHMPHFTVPTLVPLLQYTYKPALGAGAVKVIVVGRGQQTPLMTALVKMPVSELDEQ
ncbi:bardet-biedl syndrome 1 protein [Scenedesmus sp. NREL 46B-D3]|nr:bardet-biedl syndrome 1 protein [Scenedesmus sp. NREL 46B-D3]